MAHLSPVLSGRLLADIVGLRKRDFEMGVCKPGLGVVHCPLIFHEGRDSESEKIETHTRPMSSRLRTAGCCVWA